MGIDADPQISGNYFLQTNGEAPFNRGESGTTFEILKKVFIDISSPELQ